MNSDLPSYYIFKGDGKPHDDISKAGEPPPWRKPGATTLERGGNFVLKDREYLELINAAIYLRRPILVTGDPGIGKSTLAYAIAHELKLGKVLVWPINTRSTLRDGLYSYDAIGRLHEAQLKRRAGEPDIGRFMRLGPLGTAMLATEKAPKTYTPRVLLIDEIDKGDIDLPNDLLNVFEEGLYTIPELARMKDGKTMEIPHYDGEGVAKLEAGKIQTNAFPIVVMTSNGERVFPPAFLRRCIQLELKPPTEEELKKIVRARVKVPRSRSKEVDDLVHYFSESRKQKKLATDQLLNVVYLLIEGVDKTKLEAVLQSLSQV